MEYLSMGQSPPKPPKNFLTRLVICVLGRRWPIIASLLRLFTCLLITTYYVHAGEVRLVDSPVIIKWNDITEDTTFLVTKDLGNEYAVTIEGDWRPRENPRSEDRRDGPIPAVTIKCGYLSKALHLYRIDNSDIGPIWIEESRGEALTITQVRQSSFASVRCHRCTSPTCILRFIAVPFSYNTNMVNFGQVNLLANDAPVTVLFDNCLLSINRIRIINFGQLNCHPAWEPARKQFPGISEFRERRRTHVDFADAADITVSNYNMRLDPNDEPESTAFVGTDSSVTLVTGQVLRRRDEVNWKKYVKGPITVLKKGTAP